MKKISLLITVIFSFSLLFLVPYSFSYLNNLLGLKIIQSTVLTMFGVLAASVGLSLVIYCIFIFAKIGKGTPAPVEPPKKFVHSGIYSHTRNPIYLGYVLIFSSYFLVFGHLLLVLYPVIGFIILHLNLVFIEEPILIQRFGGSYEKYMKKVPRWLPRLS